MCRMTRKGIQAGSLSQGVFENQGRERTVGGMRGGTVSVPGSQGSLPPLCRQPGPALGPVAYTGSQNPDKCLLVFPGLLVLGSLSCPVPRSSAHSVWQERPGHRTEAGGRVLHSNEVVSLGAPPHPWPFAVCSWALLLLRLAETGPLSEGWSEACQGLSGHSPPAGPARGGEAGGAERRAAVEEGPSIRGPAPTWLRPRASCGFSAAHQHPAVFTVLLCPLAPSASPRRLRAWPWDGPKWKWLRVRFGKMWPSRAHRQALCLLLTVCYLS